jgi:hypothetical protein
VSKAVDNIRTSDKRIVGVGAGLQFSPVSVVLLIAGGWQGDVARTNTTLHLTWTLREKNK